MPAIKYHALDYFHSLKVILCFIFMKIPDFFKRILSIRHKCSDHGGVYFIFHLMCPFARAFLFSTRLMINLIGLIFILGHFSSFFNSLSSGLSNLLIWLLFVTIHVCYKKITHSAVHEK